MRKGGHTMLIRNTFDIRFFMPCDTAMIALLHLDPSLNAQLRSGDELVVEHVDNFGNAQRIEPREYIDVFGNRCERFIAPWGSLKLTTDSLVETPDEKDAQPWDAEQHAIDDLPSNVLQFLLSSRYCEVDRFAGIASDLFGNIPRGFALAAAIRDWAHDKVRFDYSKARSTKTAMDVFTEREGVCRDYQHLAVTLSRAMNIPARYATGYLGDIRLPYAGAGDFSAWYQVYLGGRWWTMDARHNVPRFGRVLMATGRDAADVAITTSFGAANLTGFFVESYEVTAAGGRVPLPTIGV